VPRQCAGGVSPPEARAQCDVCAPLNDWR
jgi:hypothetical protein